jgi:hypothetical protein
MDPTGWDSPDTWGWLSVILHGHKTGASICLPASPSSAFQALFDIARVGLSGLGLSAARWVRGSGCFSTGSEMEINRVVTHR